MQTQYEDENERNDTRMKRALIVMAAALMNVVAVQAMETKSLDGLWEFRFERDRMMENVKLPAFKADDHMVVPGAWNAMSRYYNQHGTGCYRRTFTLAKDLGGNFIRGSHYPQCERFLSLCDEIGILVWEESLGWGNKKEQFKDAEFCELQVEATRLKRIINAGCFP